MGILIYVILRRLFLVNEQNAMINLKNDMVKNILKLDEKNIPSILALKSWVIIVWIWCLAWYVKHMYHQDNEKQLVKSNSEI